MRVNALRRLFLTVLAFCNVVDAFRPERLLIQVVQHQPKRSSAVLLQDSVNGIGKQDLPRVVDTACAAVGAATGIYLLGELEARFGVKLYGPPLAASSIIIFSGITPPSAKNVFFGTIGAACFALCLYQLGGGTPETRAIAVAGSLIWFKTSGALFPPAAALSAVFLDSPALQTSGWSYLLFPCLSGQTILYVLAVGLAQLRQRLRVSITQSQLDFSAASLGEMREMFDRYDTSGDGRIDATELQVALRALLGSELDLADCEKLVADADSDGDGVIEFDEFVQMLRFDATLTRDATRLGE